MEAPLPKRVPWENCPDRPEFYGKEYHGIMGHKEATLLLENEVNGAFLIRKGNQFNDFYTLTWRYYITVFVLFCKALPNLEFITNPIYLIFTKRNILN